MKYKIFGLTNFKFHLILYYVVVFRDQNLWLQVLEQLWDAVGRAGAKRGRDGASAGVVAAAAVAAQGAGAGGWIAALLAVRAGQQKCFPAAAAPA